MVQSLKFKMTGSKTVIYIAVILKSSHLSLMTHIPEKSARAYLEHAENES